MSRVQFSTLQIGDTFTYRFMCFRKSSVHAAVKVYDQRQPAFWFESVCLVEEIVIPEISSESQRDVLKCQESTQTPNWITALMERNKWMSTRPYCS